MIAHASIPARDPRSTALLLALLIDGQAFEFPVVPGAWIAIANDGSGTAIEVYPDGVAHHAGSGEPDPAAQPAGPTTLPWEDQIYADGAQVRPSAFHLAITSPLTEAQVVAAARDAGLRAVVCDRAGVFGLVEVWIDGTFLVEVLSGEQPARYRRFMNPDGAAAMFGPGLRPALAGAAATA